MKEKEIFLEFLCSVSLQGYEREELFLKAVFQLLLWGPCREVKLQYPEAIFRGGYCPGSFVVCCKSWRSNSIQVSRELRNGTFFSTDSPWNSVCDQSLGVALNTLFCCSKRENCTSPSLSGAGGSQSQTIFWDTEMVPLVCLDFFHSLFEW